MAVLHEKQISQKPVIYWQLYHRCVCVCKKKQQKQKQKKSYIHCNQFVLQFWFGDNIHLHSVKQLTGDVFLWNLLEMTHHEVKVFIDIPATRAGSKVITCV